MDDAEFWAERSWDYEVGGHARDVVARDLGRCPVCRGPMQTTISGRYLTCGFHYHLHRYMVYVPTNGAPPHPLDGRRTKEERGDGV